jgi:hypothetical protein
MRRASTFGNGLKAATPWATGSLIVASIRTTFVVSGIRQVLETLFSKKSFSFVFGGHFAFVDWYQPARSTVYAPQSTDTDVLSPVKLVATVTGAAERILGGLVFAMIAYAFVFFSYSLILSIWCECHSSCAGVFVVVSQYLTLCRLHALTMKTRVFNFNRAHRAALVTGCAWLVVMIVLFIVCYFSSVVIFVIGTLGGLTLIFLITAVPTVALIVLKRLRVEGQKVLGGTRVARKAARVRTNAGQTGFHQQLTDSFLLSQTAKLSLATTVMLCLLFLEYVWLLVRRYILNVITTPENFAIHFFGQCVELGTCFILIRMLGHSTMRRDFLDAFCGPEPTNSFKGSGSPQKSQTTSSDVSLPHHSTNSATTTVGWSLEVNPPSVASYELSPR